ncbi:MAG TPA: glycosyltransferase family 9 protein [Acidimicrobiales bacterium]|nr:glycosyltransferase family 9 protein [Acidimicrobiales bacterium]
MRAPHVLVARLDNLGDVLLSGPAVRAVATGASRVTFLAGRGAAAARLLPGVDEVVAVDAPWVGDDAPAVERSALDGLVDHLGTLGIDRALVLTSFHQSPLPLALLLRMAGVAEIGATCADHPGSLLDVRHGDDPRRHEVEQALSLAERFGHRLAAGDTGRLAVRRPLPTWRPFAGRYVVLHPGASVPARGWDAGRAAACVQLLAAGGYQVAVTGGSAERHLTATVAGDPQADVADLGGALDLAGLAGVLAGAEVVVSGNTGPAHLAAAVATPVVSIFAPVVPPERWRPWGVPSILLGDHDIACAGCRARSCPVEDQPCLAGVTPEAVVDAVATLAGRRLRVPA